MQRASELSVMLLKCHSEYSKSSRCGATLKNLNLIHSPDDSKAQTTLQSKTVWRI